MDILNYRKIKHVKHELDDVKRELDEHKLKIAAVDKELDGFQKLIGGINYNQEPKQKVNGYGIIPLPKNAANGQVSAIVKGNTYTQIAEIDKRDWRNSFTAYGDSEITQNSAFINGPYSSRIEINEVIPYSQGKKYGILINATPSTAIWYRGIDREIEVNSDGIGKVIFDYDELDTNTILQRRFWRVDDKNSVLTKLIVVELNEQSEWDFNNLTLEELNNKYTYVDGTKSTISASRLKSVGKNLIPDLTMANKVGVPTSVSSVSGDDKGDFEYQLYPDGVDLISQSDTTNLMLEFKGLYVPVAPATAYVCSFDCEGGSQGRFGFREFTKDKQEIGWREYVLNKEQFITSDNCHYITIGLGVANKNNVPMSFRKVQLERGDTATEYEPYTESTAYLPNVGELRSLPNGVKDEFNVTTGVKTQRVKKYVVQASDIGHMYTELTNVDLGRVNKPVDFIYNGISKQEDLGSYVLEGYPTLANTANQDNIASIGYSSINNNQSILVYFAKGTTLEQARTALTGLSLTYQLAEPIEIPIQTSGSLVSCPSGTVYIEPFVADAGIYTDKMSVLHQDLPIKALEKISKVDFETGVETELDVSAAEILEDKKSFTHPELTEGDIVFFVYEHGAEGTIPETEISYYDSRYVIKGEDDKFYQWEIEAKLVEDVITPSIKLVEV